ncbi:hypothetical protein KVV02_003724 [Mortierella alpina]|uniref:PXA domain-containing protein n=1 Tax=Mortierella alpina TaxID=64518 RepID=A0A9P8A8R7_MORAP|nr:hypothetical protein KVV02_003724 [Mortierella alpina]
MQQQHSPSPQQQQQQQQRRSKHAKHSSQIPGSAPYPQYLRILFPRHLQLREPVPQLLSQPHPDLDAEAYHFLAFLVRDFIQTWYSSFSSDPQLVTSVVDVVIHIVRTLEQRSQEVDWVALLLQDVPEVLKRHYVNYRQASQMLETAYAPNQTIESIFHGLQPHFALRDGEESEKEYLRQLADELLRILLPEAEYRSDCVRWLVREILCCLVLRSLVEILTEPDMINYIVNTLLVDFGPSDEKYEEFLQKAEDKMAASDDNFSAFLASLKGAKGGAGRKLTHRSSTPNIKPTDEMVNMLQEAQSSALETPHHSSQSLARPERNDHILSQRLAGVQTPANQTPPASSHAGDRRLSVSPHYTPSLEPPLQIPGTTITRQVSPNTSSSTTTLTSNHPHSPPSAMSRIKAQAVWVVTEAPVEYTSFLLNQILVPFGVMLVAFLNFMLVLPKRIRQVSESTAWIYAELEAPEHSDLEVGIFSLLKEVFYLEERNQVIWRQWEIMGWPLIRTLGGGAIDRLLAHGVHWILAEPRLVMYIQAGRRALWPDPNSSLPRPRGVDEMEKARKDAERRILRAIPAPLRDVFFGDVGVQHLAAAREALEPFQKKQCNKHLMYIALDLLLSKVVPEIYPER